MEEVYYQNQNSLGEWKIYEMLYHYYVLILVVNLFHSVKMAYYVGILEQKFIPLFSHFFIHRDGLILVVNLP